MGYHHRIWKGTCGHCGKTSAWVLRGPGKMSRNWKCDCGWTDYFRPLPEWPEVPRSLYIGSDKNGLLKLYPVPPEAGRSPMRLEASCIKLREGLVAAITHAANAARSSMNLCFRTSVQTQTIKTSMHPRGIVMYLPDACLPSDMSFVGAREGLMPKRH